jgi:hypothetical protein
MMLMVFGLWFLVYGFWFLVYGFWFLVYGFWFEWALNKTPNHKLKTKNLKDLPLHKQSVWQRICMGGMIPLWHWQHRRV